MERFKQPTSVINKRVRDLSDDELLSCVHDDSVCVPAWLMSIEDIGDIANKKHGSLKAMQKALEKELNRRGIKWRQYSDEERDCLWSLQNLTYSDENVTPEKVEEFWRLVNANGGRIPYIAIVASRDGEIAVLKRRFEAIGLIAEVRLNHDGAVLVGPRQ